MEHLQLSPKSGIIPGLEANEIIIAKDQPEYAPIPALISPAPVSAVLTRWGFDGPQRDAVANGEDLFLQVLTFGNPLQPLKLTIGQPEELVQYDNRRDLFDSACGSAVKAWARALAEIGVVHPDAEQQRRAANTMLFQALHLLVRHQIEG